MFHRVSATTKKAHCLLNPTQKPPVMWLLHVQFLKYNFDNMGSPGQHTPEMCDLIIGAISSEPWVPEHPQNFGAGAQALRSVERVRSSGRGGEMAEFRRGWKRVWSWVERVQSLGRRGPVTSVPLELVPNPTTMSWCHSECHDFTACVSWCHGVAEHAGHP